MKSFIAAGVPRAKMATVYAAADERFTRLTDPAALSQVRAQYGLPDQPFFLMVVKGYARIEYAGQTLCPRKNVEGALEAYAQARAAEPDCPPMVILGAGVKDRLTPVMRGENAAASCAWLGPLSMSG